MGTYWIIVNHTKRQRLEPGNMRYTEGDPGNYVKAPRVFRGCGACALGYLLAASYHPKGSGTWRGDDVEYVPDTSDTYDRAVGEYEDITGQAVTMMQEEGEKVILDP